MGGDSEAAWPTSNLIPSSNQSPPCEFQWRVSTVIGNIAQVSPPTVSGISASIDEYAQVVHGQ